MILRTMVSATLAILCAGVPAVAEVKRLQPDFTFRRVTVPQAGSTSPRINVQVAPKPTIFSGNSGRLDDDEPAAPPAPAATWFWNTVSPDMAASGPGRLVEALDLIANPPDGGGVAAPRLQTLQDIAQAHGRSILLETVGTNVSPALVLAVISVESGGRADVESPAGAVGLMQLMPATAERFGVTERTDPAQSIKGGVAYLSWLMDHFDNDPLLVLAGYNAGEGAVRSNNGVPPYAETRNYVPKVLAAFQVAKGLCQTPPELVSDGCVFAVNNL